MMLYLASDIKLPLIAWDDGVIQSLCVTELPEGCECVKAQFSKPFVYYVGSYEGCGCGFSFGVYEVIDEDDRLSFEQGRSSVIELFDYLATNIKLTDKFELFSCLAGNEAICPEVHDKIFLSKFCIGDYFEFGDKQYIEIYK
jgi:hypothetical protein